MGIVQGEIDIYGVLKSLDKMPQQRQFISAAQQNAAYLGGQGSGKSIALCGTAILNAKDDPNGYSLIGRLNMPALESTTMKTFLELVPETWGKWFNSKKVFRFSNGHEVIFKHLDITDPKIEGHIKSLNLSAAYVDEATEISRDVYYLLVGRVRRKTAKRRIVRLAPNPAGHDWVWRLFFDPKRSRELLASNLGITASTLEFIVSANMVRAIIRFNLAIFAFPSLAV
jgi:phage terminase large subunit